MYVNFLSTYSDKKSCHTSTTLQISIARFVTLIVVWMGREFDAYKFCRSMHRSIFNSFPVIRTASAKNRHFHVPQPTFLFPSRAVDCTFPVVVWHGLGDRDCTAQSARDYWLSAILSFLFAFLFNFVRCPCNAMSLTWYCHRNQYIVTYLLTYLLTHALLNSVI